MILSKRNNFNIRDFAVLLFQSSEIRGYPDKVLHEFLIIEYLREIIFLLSKNKDKSGLEDPMGAFVPVHIKSITYFFKKNIGDIFGSDLATNLSLDSIKRKLILIQLIGDITYIKGGYWLPTPVRIIQFPNNDFGVVGGNPSSDLETNYFLVSKDAVGRRVTMDGDTFNKVFEFDLLLQPFNMWQEWKPDNLKEWTNSQVNMVARMGSNSSSSFIEFEVYNLFKSLKGAWVRYDNIPTDETVNGVFLCRTIRKPRYYFLGYIKDMKLNKEMGLSRSNIPWLQMGLRWVYGVPLKVIWKGNFFSVYPSPPKAVEQELMFYCQKIVFNGSSQYYVVEKLKPTVESILDRYAYKTKEKYDD